MYGGAGGATVWRLSQAGSPAGACDACGFTRGARNSRCERRGPQRVAMISWSGGSGGGPRRANHHWYKAPLGCTTEDCVEKPTVRGAKKGPPFKSDFGIRNRRDFEKESLSKNSEEIFGKFGRGGAGHFSNKNVGFWFTDLHGRFSCGKIRTVRFLGLVACHHVCLVRTFELFGSCWFGVAVRCAVVRSRAVRRCALRCAVQRCVAARGAARCVVVWRSAVHVC